MRWQTGMVLTLMLLPACRAAPPERGPKQVELWVRVVDDGAGNKKVEIDRSEEHHDSVIVEPGDRIAWACLDGSAPDAEPKRCSADLEFAIDDVHFVADLGQLVEMLRRPQVLDPAQLEALSQELQALRDQALSTAAGSPKGEATPADEDQGRRRRATATLMGGEVRFEGPVGEMIRVVRVSEAATAAAARGPSPTLFADEAVDSIRFIGGDKELVYKSGDQLIRSAPVAGGIGDGVWKFTWRVRLKDVEGSEDTLDPHIFTHDDVDG